jgi:hypothetical protein
LFASEFLLLFFYFDDIAILYSKRYRAQAEDFERRLLQRYKIRSLGELQWILGIHIERERPARKIWLCQDLYISKIAAKFNINTNSKLPRTPLPTEELYARSNDNAEHATAKQILAYQQRVRSINFAATITRPIENSGQCNTQIFNCASDAAFAGDIESCRSSDGYLFQLYGGAIDWRASKQKRSPYQARRQSCWRYQWRPGKSFSGADSSELFDSIPNSASKSSAITSKPYTIWTKEALKLDTKLRHVDIHQHWLRQEIEKRNIDIEWLATADMPADGLTKPLPGQKHNTFAQQLNLADIAGRLTVSEGQCREEEEKLPILAISDQYLEHPGSISKK